jgi:hypothetical protein
VKWLPLSPSLTLTLTHSSLTHSLSGAMEEYPPDSEQVFMHQEAIPDANKRYLMICEENARAQMALESPTHNHSAQRVGRLYGTGMNHPIVDEGVSREVDGHSIGGSPIRNTATSAIIAKGTLPDRKGKLAKEKGGLMNNTISIQHSMANKHNYPTPVQSQHGFSAYPSHTGGGGGIDLKYDQPLKAAAALGMVDKQPGGKYYVPNHLHEPYTEPLVVRLTQIMTDCIFIFIFNTITFSII